MTEGEERMKTESGVKEWKWPRWVVSSSAGLYLVCCCVTALSQPVHRPIPSQEIRGFLLGFILPPAAAMILSAFGFFSVTFLISLWILLMTLFSLEGDPVGPLRFALAATICIVSAVMCLRGIIRALRDASDTQTISSDIATDTRTILSGRSPLYDAAQEGKLDIVQELVELGADVNEKIGNESVLEIAVEGGHYETVRFLVAHGAKIYHSLLGRSQIRRARYLKHDDSADFLQEELAKQSRTTGDK
jgi:hypothetical protein